MMEWKDLSNDAKGVIEWVENPYTSRKNTITISVGDVFNPVSDVNILITAELYNEIKEYVTKDKNMETLIMDTEMSFWLR